MITRLLGMVLIGLVLAAGGTTAQYATGDILVADLNGTTLWGIDQSGKAYTVSTKLPFTVFGLMCAPDNRSVWVSGFTSATAGQTVQLAPDGSVTSLQPSGFYGLDVDGAGDVLGAGRASIARVKNGQVQTLYSGNPLAWIRGGAVDLATGAYIAHDNATYFYRFDYYPKYALAQLTSGLVKIAPPVTGLCTDPATGEMLCTRDRQVVSMNVGTKAVKTLFDLGLSSGPNAFGALVRDPADGTFLAPACLYRTGQPAGVLRIDPANKTVSTVALLPGVVKFDLAGIAIARSRHLAGMNEAQVGQPYGLRVSVPNDAFAAYVVAMSFGFRPGFKITPKRTVHLNPDPLFAYSLTNSGIFSGFQGMLDAQGEAVATLRVPNIAGLRGTRLFAAALTLRRGQVSVISAPVGFTIR